MKKKEDEARVSVASNRKAHHKYAFGDTFEAGLSLYGPEVKSLRAGQVSLDGAYALISDDGPVLLNLHISPYPQSRREIEPTRTRKLLLHAKEIDRLFGLTQTKGVTLIPLEIYFKRGWAKVMIGVAKAKLGPDRREEIKKKDLAREMEGTFKGRIKM